MPTPGPSLTIDELRNAVLRALDQCERELGADVEFAADHYWIIGPSDAFDLTTEPTPTVGQLTDDIEAIAAEGDDPTWHQLAHIIGPLLRLASLSQSTPV